MADEKKNDFWAAIGSMFQDKKKDKEKKNAAEKIKSATESKNDQLNSLYDWQSGKN